jgi:hypothetical protein
MADPAILFPLTEPQRLANERHIARTNALLRSMVRAFLVQAWAHGLPLILTQSRRTDAVQFGYFKIGRENIGGAWVPVPGGHVVTKAATVEGTPHGCVCRQRLKPDADCACACAVDFAFLVDGRIVGPLPGKGNDSFDADLPWPEAGAFAKSLGFHWGGDFHGFADLGHLEHPQWRDLRAEYARRNA